MNNIIKIISSILTLLITSIIITIAIFYFLGYPLTSLMQHQNYVFFAILIGIVLASIVYGAFGNEKISYLTKYLNESLGLKVKEKDVDQLLRKVKRVPPFLINSYISKDINAITEFESQIKDYKNQISADNLENIRKVMEIPISEFQNILNEFYMKTGMEQFKILANPDAKDFLTMNLQELKKIL